MLASTVEAAGNVILEAMAAGRPVVCTDSGGPPAYVRDGEVGFVVPVGDDRMMAERIRLLLRNPILRESLGSGAHQLASGELSYDRMISELINVYDDVLNKGDNSAPR